MFPPLDRYPNQFSTPQKTPGVCSLCGSSQRTIRRGAAERPERVYALLDVDFEGRVFMCETCLMEHARAADMIPVEESKATKADVSRHERRERAVADAAEPARRGQKALTELMDAMGW